MTNEPTEPKAMQWLKFADDALRTDEARQIVAWVNANGGEARYEPYGHGSPSYPRPHVAVRTADGWAYAKPGDWIEKTDEWFEYMRHGSTATRTRAFRVSGEKP